MMSQHNSIRASYIKALDNLYQNIDSWLEPTELSAKITKNNVKLNEEATGTYYAPQLTILYGQNKSIATLEPVAAHVLGANGRVDLVGLYDRAYMLYFNDLNTKPVNQQGVLLLNPGVTKPGWYWIPNRINENDHLLDKDVFKQLITEVSDYEF